MAGGGEEVAVAGGAGKKKKKKKKDKKAEEGGDASAKVSHVTFGVSVVFLWRFNPLKPQSRFGDETLGIILICP